MSTPESRIREASEAFAVWLTYPLPQGLTEEEIVEAWRRACMEAGRLELIDADVLAASRFGFADGLRLGKGALAKAAREKVPPKAKDAR